MPVFEHWNLHFCDKLPEKKYTVFVSSCTVLAENSAGVLLSIIGAVIILFTSFGQYFFVPIMQCGSINHNVPIDLEGNIVPILPLVTYWDNISL